MKNTTPHRNKGFRKKAKAPRGAYTYLRAPVILTGDNAKNAPVVPAFTPPALSSCRGYGMQHRPTVTPVIDVYSRAILGIIIS